MLRFASLPVFAPLDIVKQIPRIALQIPSPKSSTYASLTDSMFPKPDSRRVAHSTSSYVGTLSKIRVLEAPRNGFFSLPSALIYSRRS